MGEHFGTHSKSEGQTGPIGELSSGEKRNRVDEEVVANGKRSRLDNDTVNGKTQPSR